ncbi:uncharacterized protein AMSG_08880 [Thecamonas trahens ATCC 50062]|uniref:Uncharacterized protein n=1 Tax=Thecamonas trahens ATCC 50062 TaxID=461836 RepID=A0A0L0DM80_THETB|nr:hypothetical protein AMSG_08880 [Thecamonas trahens ATCC 50062]KNC53375.1 hypothetical protein AMSG_08880 [Thecamonas trahens ATCC 50062]|eukprot:XP_013754420.1 hypothetical protein AMSG_08880 [Thecamonas trahens ATCC 50062]
MSSEPVRKRVRNLAGAARAAASPAMARGELEGDCGRGGGDDGDDGQDENAAAVPVSRHRRTMEDVADEGDDGEDGEDEVRVVVRSEDEIGSVMRCARVMEPGELESAVGRGGRAGVIELGIGSGDDSYDYGDYESDDDEAELVRAAAHDAHMFVLAANQYAERLAELAPGDGEAGAGQVFEERLAALVARRAVAVAALAPEHVVALADRYGAAGWAGSPADGLLGPGLDPLDADALAAAAEALARQR